MKFYNFIRFNRIFFIIVVLVISGCDGNQDEIDHDFYDISLSSDKVHLWLGQSIDIGITKNSDQKLYAKSSNPDIADCYINGNILTVTAKEVGNAVINIYDSFDNKALVNVKSATFNGSWTIDVRPSLGINYEIIIDCDDTELKQEIETQILEDLKLRHKSRYSFYTNSNIIVTINNNDTKNHATYTGNYAYNNGNLILNYNNTKEEFLVNPISYYIVELVQNQTQKWIDKYPQHKITNVTISKYLIRDMNL